MRIESRLLADFFEQEVPAGTVDGVNDEFTLSNVPHSNASVILTLNGVIKRQTADYTISGDTITFVAPPELGQTLYAFYVRR